jgi:hypothetical protein
LIEGVAGRDEETLNFPAAQGGGTVRLHPVFFHRLMDRVPSHGWQIRQRDNGLEILIARPAPDFDAATLAADLAQSLRRHGVAPLDIAVRSVEAAPRTRAGKAPLIVAAKARPVGGWAEIAAW